jgi:hypothetical protein
VVAERRRAGVAEARNNVAVAHALHVTISIGCVTLERDGFATRHQIVDAAARAPASAKRDGGDRVVALVDKAGESLDRSAPAV